MADNLKTSYGIFENDDFVEENSQLRELANDDGVLWPAWIPATERLPENDDCVLAVVSGKQKNIELVDAIEIASFWRDEGWILNEYPEWEDPKVSYWMPLPPAPEVR